MNWLILVVLANLSDSLRIYLDNYVSDVYFKKYRTFSQKLFYGITGIIAGIIILIVTGYNFVGADYGAIGLLILSGFFSVFSSIPYLKTLELDDSTNLGIFIQLSPILYLVLGWFFLGESFSPMQLVAFAIILAAPMLIILTTRKRSRHTKIKAVFYAFLYVLIAVIGNLIFVVGNDNNTDFVSSIGFLALGKGLGDIVLIAIQPKLRRRFFTVVKKSKYKVLRPMTADYIISLIKDFTYRGALVAAPTVAIASAAADSTEPIFIFFIGIVLTLIWPNFGREKLDRKSVIIHLTATVLAVIGIILLQV